MKTVTQGLVCAGATLALAAAIKHEEERQKEANKANDAWEKCLNEHSGSHGGG